MTYASQKRRARRDRKREPRIEFTVHVVSKLDSNVTCCGKRIGTAAQGWERLSYEQLTPHDRMCFNNGCSAEERVLALRRQSGRSC